MPIRYPGDGETEQIGKLIDAGHHRLFGFLIAFRWVARVGLAVLALLAVHYAPTAVSAISTLAR